ncbi:hypothetical protein DMJ13_18285 [halophilic archaeon]|nr:hypothetical protein DMJ13_18285 [halophilic archaeon]
MPHEKARPDSEMAVTAPQTVLLALDATAGDDGVYHVMNDAGTGSVCGQLQKDDLFAGNPDEIVSRSEAETRGLQPCHHCMTYTGER